MESVNKQNPDLLPLLNLITSIIAYMETPKWKPSEEEREVMEAVWMQVKGACEKLKEETNAQDDHIRKMLQEMADRYYS